MTMLDELHEARRAEGAKIDPKNAEVTFWWTHELDPYGDIPAEEFPKEWECVGRSYFARSLPDGQWIYFGDLPEATVAEIERLMSEGFYKDPVTNDRLSTGIMDDIRNNRLGGFVTRCVRVAVLRNWS
jgi:hypothetical protein